MGEKMNAGEIAWELLGIAEDMIDSGEDPEDVRAAFIAGGIKLKQLRDQAAEDARNMILKSMS